MLLETVTPPGPITCCYAPRGVPEGQELDDALAQLDRDLVQVHVLLRRRVLSIQLQWRFSMGFAAVSRDSPQGLQL